MRTVSRQERVAHIITSLEQYDPQRVILFGSWARGDEDEYSDLDVPTRYPNALPGGVPAEVYDEEDATGAIASAYKVLAMVRKVLP